MRTRGSSTCVGTIVLLAVLAVAACGGPVGPPSGTSTTQLPPPSSPVLGSSVTMPSTPTPARDTVSGHVRWPDGTTAANVQLEVYPNGYPYGGESSGDIQQTTTDATGTYVVRGCGCSALGLTFSLTSSQNAGNFCYIIMRSQGRYTVPAEPGSTIDWTMADMPCSRSYVNAQGADKIIALLKEDPSTSGGTWQQARSRSAR